MKRILLTFAVVFVTINISAVELHKDNATIQDSLLFDEKLYEVVVSAGRMPQRLSTIPASITLVTSKELNRLSAFSMNLNELLSLTVPGLAPQAEGYSDWGQTLRGRRLLTMIDGVPISTSLRPGQIEMNNINPIDLERVEVIKGASAMYGNGGDGGFVNYITKTPTSETKFAGTTQLWGTQNLAKLNDALGGGVYQSFRGGLQNLAYMASVGYENRGSQYDAHGTPLQPTYGNANTQKYTGFGKLMYALTDNQQLIFSTNYYRSRQNSPYEPVLAELRVLNANGDYELTPGYGKKKSSDYPEKPTGATSFSSLFKYNLSDIFAQTTMFTTDFYFQKSENIFFYSRSFENGGQTVINSEKFGIRPNFITNLDRQNVKTSLIYGVDMLRDRTNQGLLDGRMWIPNMRLHSIAPYAQTNLQIKDQLVIKAGIRYDAMSLNVADYQTLRYSPRQDDNFNPSVSVKGGTMNFDRLSVNLGVRYIANQHFIPFLSFTQGFSLPDIGRILRETDNPEIIRQLAVKAIATDNYEIGFLTHLSMLRIEASAYYSKSNRGTGLAFNEASNRFEQAITPQHIYGAELSVEAQLLRNKLFVGSSYTWVEGLTHKANDNKTLTYVRGDVIAAPKLTGYVTYQISPKLQTNANVVYVGNRQRFNPTAVRENNWRFNHGEVPVKAYTVVNLSLGYSLLSNMKMTLAVNNLLNNYYLPARSQWAAPLRQQSPVGEGMNTKLTLQYDF